MGGASLLHQPKEKFRMIEKGGKGKGGSTAAMHSHVRNVGEKNI